MRAAAARCRARRPAMGAGLQLEEPRVTIAKISSRKRSRSLRPTCGAGSGMASFTDVQPTGRARASGCRDIRSPVRSHQATGVAARSAVVDAAVGSGRRVIRMRASSADPARLRCGSAR